METNRVTKTNQIQKHLEEHGSITSWDAIQKYGATRLSAIIYTLRHKRLLNITNEEVVEKDRNGNTVVFVRYVLNKGGVNE